MITIFATAMVGIAWLWRVGLFYALRCPTALSHAEDKINFCGAQSKPANALKPMKPTFIFLCYPYLLL
jgi:hypothetical protein